MPRTLEGRLDASGKRFAIIVARFNSLVTKELLAGALDSLARHGADLNKVDIVWVPGSFEMPVAARLVAKKGGYDGLIALGCVLRGATPHNQYIASEVTKGLAQIAMETGLPVGYGVLTPDSMEQALERAGMKAGNKGAEAAESVIEMVDLVSKLRDAK